MAENKRVVLGLILTLIVILGIGTLVFFNTRIFISGPQITIFEPENGSAFDTPFIELKGEAKNVAFISLNDHPIFIEENGRFNEKLLLNPGLSIIELYARDRFDREETLILQYVYMGSEDGVEIIPELDLEEATSTEAI